VWNMPPLGTINVHASLLPQYRGAAPINRAIMNGETETGVTTFKLQHAIDTGNILLQERVAILDEDNSGTLHDKLMEAGARLLVETVKGLAAGTLKEIPQPQGEEAALKMAPKLFKEDMQINWQQPAKAVCNHIRGLSPYPAAWTALGGKTLKIYKARSEEAVHTATPGAYETDHRKYLRFAAADGWVYAEELQQEGKKRMGVQEFLRGFRG
jgi:methionyl-tRNA formyltransferase